MADELESLLNVIENQNKTFLLWEILAADGKFELIDKLRRVELREPGYGTIVVPKEGFSDNDEIHNIVLDWLEEQNVNILNVNLEIARLKRALKEGTKNTQFQKIK